MPPSFRVLRQDLSQRDEGTSVFLPGGEDRESRKARGLRGPLENRTGPPLSEPRTQKGREKIAVIPEPGKRRGEERFGETRGALEKLLRSVPERELDAASRSKEVRDGREGRTLDPAEEEDGSPGGHDAAVDLRGLEVRVHLRGDLGDFPLAPEDVQVAPQVREATGDGQALPPEPPFATSRSRKR